MNSAMAIAPQIGIVAACIGLGVARATFYRVQRPVSVQQANVPRAIGYIAVVQRDGRCTEGRAVTLGVLPANRRSNGTCAPGVKRRAGSCLRNRPILGRAEDGWYASPRTGYEQRPRRG